MLRNNLTSSPPAVTKIRPQKTGKLYRPIQIENYPEPDIRPKAWGTYAEKCTMVPGTRPALVLLHQKSGQRYALERGSDFVIGRSRGTVIFGQDPKLSSKHCLIRTNETGSTIYDLKSRTGILVNGAHLTTGKAWELTVGARFTVGDQTFEVAVERRVRPRQKPASIFASIAAIAGLLIGMELILPPRQEVANASHSPAPKVEKAQAQLPPWDISPSRRPASITLPQTGN